MKYLSLEAPGKINLSLRILGKRQDGYHELYTVFQRIGLADRLYFREIKKGIVLRCDHPGLTAPADNLVFKACRLIQAYTGLNAGIEIRLEKKIPLASGLGGGSSDAASTLIGMNRFFRLGLKKDELLNMGKRLGADVPFFILETPQALGTGRGDELTAMDFPTKLSLFLTFFSEGVSTKAVYQSVPLAPFPLSLTKISCDATMLSDFLAAKDLSAVSTFLRNDLFKSACQIKPAIGRILSFLRKDWACSAMSGSGPTLFSLVDNIKEARIAAKKVSRSLGLMTWAGSMG